MDWVKNKSYYKHGNLAISNSFCNTWLSNNITEMQDTAAAFDGLDPYVLSPVHISNRRIGAGSYATVIQVDYLGLKCAGKRIHEALLMFGNTTYPVHRFQEECRLLSQIRHPNIVQFLGVHFEEGSKVPIMIMEFLPTNLTSCIEKYGILPSYISYSILHDVILGLHYLHSQMPPIIHRDLSSNNVLLNTYMSAKISDLGVARILDISPQKACQMTKAPGTPAYMPPEVIADSPVYNSNVDTFSYGIMIIHVFSSKWPEPHLEQVSVKDGKMVPFSEAERRENYLKIMGKDHPLMDLVLKCIHNDPSKRADANDIKGVLVKKITQFPALFSNRLEMIQFIKDKEEQNRILKEEKSQVNEGKLQEIEALEQTLQLRCNEIERLKIANEIQITELVTNIEDLKKENDALHKRNYSLTDALRHHKEGIDNAVLMLCDTDQPKVIIEHEDIPHS